MCSHEIARNFEGNSYGIPQCLHVSHPGHHLAFPARGKQDNSSRAVDGFAQVAAIFKPHPIRNPLGDLAGGDEAGVALYRLPQPEATAQQKRGE